MGDSSGTAVALFSLLAGLSLHAQQNTATILGNVNDPSGGATVGAQVTAREESTGFTRGAATDESGAFVVPLLPVGNYLLTVEPAGFKSFTRKGISLQLNQNARVPVVLEVGSTSERIEVVAAVPLVDTVSAAGGDVVDRRRITGVAAQRTQRAATRIASPRRDRVAESEELPPQRTAGTPVSRRVLQCIQSGQLRNPSERVDFACFRPYQLRGIRAGGATRLEIELLSAKLTRNVSVE